MMKFYVVQFEESPYPNIEKYVCVPSSWIRRFKLRRVKVAYPTEHPEKTKRRVENEERFKNKWKLYKAYVKYDTDEYDEAEIWIDVMYAIENDDSAPPVPTKNNMTTDAVKKSDPENRDVPHKNKPLAVDNEDDQSALLVRKETKTSETQPSNPSEEILVIKEEPTENELNTPTEHPILPFSGKQPKIEPTESENNLKLSSDSIKSSSEELINQEVSNQPSQTQVKVDKTCCVVDRTETLFTVETFNFLNNSSKLLQEKRISVVSDDFLFRGQVETPSKSYEINSNEQASLPGEHNKKLAIQMIETNLIKYAEYQQAQQNKDITVNQNQIHPEPIQDKENRESSEVNNIDDQKQPPCKPNDVSFTVQNVTNTTNHSSCDKQYFTPQDTFLQQDSNKEIIKGPVGMTPLIQETAHHNIPPNTVTAAQNNSNLANNVRQPFEESHENQRLSPLIDFSVEYWLTNESSSGTIGQVVSQQNLLSKDISSGGSHTRDSQETTSQSITSNVPILPNQPYLSGGLTENQDYNVTIQRDSNINKIVITRSKEMECNNESVPARSITNTISSAEHYLSATNQACKVSKRRPQGEFSAATKKRSSHDSSASKSIVRTTTGGVPMDLLGYGTSNTNNQSQFYRLEQNGSLIPSSEAYPHYSYNLNMENSNVQEKTNRRNSYRKATKTRASRAQESPNSVNNSNQLSDRCEQRLAPIFKGYVLQDPRTGAVYVQPITAEHFADSSHNVTKHTKSVKQNIPTSNTSNKSSQFPEHPHANQYWPISQHCYRPNCTIHINDNNQRPYPQNSPKSTPPTAQKSSAPNHSNSSYSHGRQYLTVDQYQNRVPRIQQTLGERTTNVYSSIERIETNAENRPYVVQNSFNIPNQSYPTFRNPIDESYTSRLVVPSNQQSINREMHLDRNINQNLIDPSANSKDKTVEQSFSIKNYSSRSPIDELLNMCKSKPNKNPLKVVEKSNASEIENLQNEFNELCRKIDTAVSETYQKYNQMHDSYIEYVKTLTKVMKRVNDFCEMKINEVSQDIEGNKQRNEELKRSYKNIGNNVDEKDINDDCESHKDLKKKCVHKRSSSIWNPYHGITMI